MTGNKNPHPALKGMTPAVRTAVRMAFGEAMAEARVCGGDGARLEHAMHQMAQDEFMIDRIAVQAVLYHEEPK